jgi:hypothetical protein
LISNEQLGLFVFERLCNQKGVTEEEEQDVLQKIKETKKKCLSTLKDAFSELISQKETQRIQNSLNNYFTSKSEMVVSQKLKN